MSGNVRGLFDTSDGASDDEGKRNELYTGGIDNRGGGGSGMAVYGPPGEGGSSGDVFDRLVQAAQNGGPRGEGVEGEVPSMPPQSAGGPGSGNSRTITLYSNGFQVDDGPLREPNTPENRKFLEELLKGNVPSELRSSAGPGGLEINLADKRTETYTPPAYVAFSGGAALGTSAPTSDDAVFVDDHTPVPPLVDAEPSTTVQVKTSDGKKLRLKLNTSITVRELGAAIRAQQAGAGPARFTLSAGFPPKELTDPTTSLRDAGLTGAAIVQKSA
jgi:UBX domain-containing protein 1